MFYIAIGGHPKVLPHLLFHQKLPSLISYLSMHPIPGLFLCEKLSNWLCTTTPQGLLHRSFFYTYSFNPSVFGSGHLVVPRTRTYMTESRILLLWAHQTHRTGTSYSSPLKFWFVSTCKYFFCKYQFATGNKKLRNYTRGFGSDLFELIIIIWKLRVLCLRRAKRPFLITAGHKSWKIINTQHICSMCPSDRWWWRGCC